MRKITRLFLPICLVVTLLCSFALAEDVHVHSFGEWVITEQATCTEAGMQMRICTTCGATEKEAIPAKGHSFGEWVITEQATCTEAGTRMRICTTCGATEKETIPAKGHSFGEWVTTKQATCTEAGTRMRICTTCGATEKETIPMLNHTAEAIPGKPATCTETGLTEGSKCSVCGETLVVQETIPAAKHQYKNQVIAPTETSRGYTRYTCSVCGAVYRDQFTSLSKAAEDAPVSLVTDLNNSPKAYEEAQLADQATQVITVAAQADHSFTASRLHITNETLRAWKERGIEKVSFVVGNVTVTFALADLENESIAAIAADIGQTLGYWVTVDFDAESAVTVGIISADEAEIDVTAFMEALQITEAE